MGFAKTQSMERADEKVERWNSLAKTKGWACKNCSNPIPYEEREIYFEVGYCGHCEYMLQKLEQD
jgi:hypothetical protein